MGASEAIAFARAQIGKPYEFGATGPNTYDCSGLIEKACQAGGVKVGRVTQEQIFNGSEVSKAALSPGDLVFPDLGHVQLYVGADRVIEAPHTGAFVREVSIGGFWRARRVFDPSQAGVPITTIPVANPLDILTKFPVLGQLAKLATTLQSTDFWRRLGVGTFGIFILLVGFAFVNRQRIAHTATSTVKTAAKVGEVAAL